MSQQGQTAFLYRSIGLLALAVSLMVLAADRVQAFFPAAPTSGSGSGGGGQGGGGGNTGSVPPPPGGSYPPPGPGIPGSPGGSQGPGGGGGGVPEIDPGALAGALGLLLSGALILTDRFRRT